jgi:hypothetical protein
VGSNGGFVQRLAWWTHYATADGAAGQLKQGDGVDEEIWSGDGRLWGAVHTLAYPPALHTKKGILGRDLRR